MTKDERLLDIQSLGIFNDNELSNLERENDFTSWEYYLVRHLTNEELYYTNDEEAAHLADMCASQHDTDKGRIYLFT